MHLDVDTSRVNILGVGVHPISMLQAISSIDHWIKAGATNYVCVTPAHAIMDCYLDPSLYPIYNQSGLTTPDGMAVVWILKLWGYSSVERVYGPDLFREVCEVGLSHGYSHFLYGGKEGVADKLRSQLQDQWPEIRISGTYAPPFRPLTDDEDEAIISMLNTSGADILWVGLGSPRQEKWMADHLGKINIPVMIGVGAAFDFLSSSKPHAPRWIQRSGMEWFFRLLSEPRRLWPRYRKYPMFLILVLLQSLRLREFPMDFQD